MADEQIIIRKKLIDLIEENQEWESTEDGYSPAGFINLSLFKKFAKEAKENGLTTKNMNDLIYIFRNNRESIRGSLFCLNLDKITFFDMAYDFDKIIDEIIN